MGRGRLKGKSAIPAREALPFAGKCLVQAGEPGVGFGIGAGGLTEKLKAFCEEIRCFGFIQGVILDGNAQVGFQVDWGNVSEVRNSELQGIL